MADERDRAATHREANVCNEPTAHIQLNPNLRISQAGRLICDHLRRMQDEFDSISEPEWIDISYCGVLVPRDLDFCEIVEWCESSRNLYEKGGDVYLTAKMPVSDAAQKIRRHLRGQHILHHRITLRKCPNYLSSSWKDIYFRGHLVPRDLAIGDVSEWCDDHVDLDYSPSNLEFYNFHVMVDLRNRIKRFAKNGSLHLSYRWKNVTGDKPQKGGDPESTGEKLSEAASKEVDNIGAGRGFSINLGDGSVKPFSVETFSYNSCRYVSQAEDAIRLISSAPIPATDRIRNLEKVRDKADAAIKALIEAEVSE